MKDRIIRTVAGDVSPDSIDFFHCHEHIWIDGNKLGSDSPVRPIDDFQKSLSELALLSKRTAIVDCQPVSAGGSTAILKSLSAKSGVGIISSTGFHKMCFYHAESSILNAKLCDLKRKFSNESRKCGVIKTAVEKNGIRGRYEILHTAASSVSRATGLKVVVHTDPGSYAVDVLDFYRENGVEETSVVLCHLDRTEPDISVHIEAARRGAYLEYDTIARGKYHSDEEEIGIIRKICDAGLSDKILLGLDTTRERLKGYSGSAVVGLDYIEKTFITKLKAHGFSDGTIALFVRENPRTALSFIPKEK
ncbi:MAG: hypothetical protein J5563_08895 [Clostridia bacterium]|nr:hypothetical protein [Clostridia bacterium]